MAQFRVKLKGKGKLAKRLKEADEETVAAVRSAVAEAAKAIRDEAQERAPRDSGALRESITITTSDGGLNARVQVGEYYGVMIEYGTKSMRAQPFLTPAAEAERKKFPNRLDAEIKRRLDLK